MGGRAGRRSYPRTLRKIYCDKGHDRRGNVTSFGHCRTCDIERKRRARRMRAVVPKSEWTHCARGHPFSGRNLLTRRHPDGSIRQRMCRTCYNARCREHMRRRRARLRGEPPPPLKQETLRKIDEALRARQRCPWTSV